MIRIDKKIGDRKKGGPHYPKGEITGAAGERKRGVGGSLDYRWPK